MEKPTAQIGVADSADFEENTWTFFMDGGDFSVSAGRFAIIPLEKYEEMVAELERLNTGSLGR